MAHPSDKILDELQQLLTTSYNECVQKEMPFMASCYDAYIRALRGLRIDHAALQEHILFLEEEADQADDESVEQQILSK